MMTMSTTTTATMKTTQMALEQAIHGSHWNETISKKRRPTTPKQKHQPRSWYTPASLTATTTKQTLRTIECACDSNRSLEWISMWNLNASANDKRRKIIIY